jgi:hypothetical protein
MYQHRQGRVARGREAGPSRQRTFAVVVASKNDACAVAKKFWNLQSCGESGGGTRSHLSPRNGYVSPRNGQGHHIGGGAVGYTQVETSSKRAGWCDCVQETEQR